MHANPSSAPRQGLRCVARPRNASRSHGAESRLTSVGQPMPEDVAGPEVLVARAEGGGEQECERHDRHGRDPSPSRGRASGPRRRYFPLRSISSMR